MKRVFSARSENSSAYQNLANLKDRYGNNALTPAHLRIVEYISSFTIRLGCFASNSCINRETINAKSPKTLRRHLEYLIAIGAISLTQRQDGDKMTRILRLAMPQNGVLSQKDFRVAKGLPEYSYARPQQIESVEEAVIQAEETPMDSDPKDEWDDSFYVEKLEQKEAPKEDIFLEIGADNFAGKKDIFADEGANLSPILNRTTNEETKKERQLPPKVPPRTPDLVLSATAVSSGVAGFAGSLRDPEAQPNDRLSLTGGQTAGLPNNEKNFSLSSQKPEENQDEVFSEPLLKKKRGKRPKNDRERRAEAVKLSNAGHIVNPASGIKDTRKRQLNWRNACDIAPTGKVTVAQLWKHLVLAWDKVFGEGTIENMVSRDKTAMTSNFDNFRQLFIDTCNFEPTNRDLAEYFDWFLEPKRVADLLANSKYSDPNAPKSTMHFRALFGRIFAVRFYEQVIKKRQIAATPVAEISKADEFIGRVDKYFEKFRKAEDEWEFTTVMIQSGYALTAQYLHDEKEMSESECKQRIIYLMADRIKTSKEPKKSIEHLKLGLRTTEENAPLLLKESCIWFDWKEKTKDLLEIAIEQSGVDYERQRNGPSASGGE